MCARRRQSKYFGFGGADRCFRDRVAVWNAAVLCRCSCRCRRISGGRASGQRNLRERTGGDRSNNVEEHDGHIASRRDGKRHDYATTEKGVRNVTFDLNGHTLQATESGGAAGFATITVPANMQLTIVGPGTVAGGTRLTAVDCRGALHVEGGTFTSDATLMRFAETDETSAQGSFRAGTFTASLLFNLLDDALKILAM